MSLFDELRIDRDAKQPVRIQQEFRTKQWRQTGQVVATVLLLLVLGCLRDRHAAVLRSEWLGIGFVLLALASLAFNYFNWRCPGCDVFWGKRRVSRRCPECGVELED